LRLIVFFIAAFILWKITAPVQNKALTFFSEGMVRLFDHHDFTRSMRTSGTDILVSFQPSQDNRPLVINSAKITYNISFLFALLMAVPKVPVRQRAKILVIGIIILFFIQIVRVNIIIFYFYCRRMQLYGQPVYAELVRYGLFYTYEVMRRLSGMLFPVIIWAGLYFYYRWHPQLRK